MRRELNSSGHILLRRDFVDSSGSFFAAGFATGAAPPFGAKNDLMSGIVQLDVTKKTRKCEMGSKG